MLKRHPMAVKAYEDPNMYSQYHTEAHQEPFQRDLHPRQSRNAQDHLLYTTNAPDAPPKRRGKHHTEFIQNPTAQTTEIACNAKFFGTGSI